MSEAAETNRVRSPRLVFLLAVLAAAVYAPFLEFPFIGSSFIEIPVARLLSTPGALHLLFANANWHFRITYALLNSGLVNSFGFQPRAFYIAGATLHACCVLAIYSLYKWKALPGNAALWAAGFFAVYQGHHGAVVLMSSWPDLLTGLVGCLALVCWIGWVERESRIGYALALLFFIAALISGETAVVVWLLLLIPWLSSRRQWIAFSPFATLTLAVVVIQLLNRPNAVAWRDSVPPLDPWWVTFAWTAVALAVVTLGARSEMRRLAFLMAGWVCAAFAVDLYTRGVLNVSGNSTYLASIGVAILWGLAFSTILQRWRVPVAAAVAFVIVVGNVSLHWSFSRKQLLAYAGPTSALVGAAMYAASPIELRCFPYPIEIAEAAAGWVGGKIAPPADRMAVRKSGCMAFRYQDANGSVRQVFQKPKF